jgi:VWFA-related protein
MSAVTRAPRFVISLIALLLAGGPLAGQDVPVFSSNVNVVNVLATVRDKHGDIVNNLTKDDFILEEDGKPQTIKYFSRDTNLPLTLGLLVDTSVSQISALPDEKRASSSFATDILREGEDSSFLIHFDTEVELLQDVTTSRQKLVSRLQDLEIGPSFRRSGGSPGGDDPSASGRHRGGPGAGTLLYDAIYLGADEILAKQQGRKAMIVLSDGVDHGSKMSLEQAIETAQRANTMVYSIYFAGEEGGGGGVWRRPGGGYPGGGRWPGGGYPPGRPWPNSGGWPGAGSPPIFPQVGWPGGGYPGGGGGYPGGRRYPGPMSYPSANGKKILERLSRETGGRMFVVSDKMPIDKIYAQIEDELRNQYNLGYTPDPNTESSSEYHHIKVTAKQKDLKVQAREGYYSSRPLSTGAGR